MNVETIFAALARAVGRRRGGRLRARRRCEAGEAYQIIGALAHAAGFFGHPDINRALDYFSGKPIDGGDILPWPREPLPTSLLPEGAEGWRPIEARFDNFDRHIDERFASLQRYLDVKFSALEQRLRDLEKHPV